MVRKKKFTLSTTQIVLLSFLLTILVGSGLLALPISSATGEAVPIRSFRTVLSKPGPAYWNAAMIRLIRPEFDGGRGEKHGEVSRGPVGKHLSSKKRQLRTAVLVGKRNNRIALRPVTEHDASGGTIAFIQFFAIHALNYTKTHPIQQSRCCIIAK